MRTSKRQKWRRSTEAHDFIRKEEINRLPRPPRCAGALLYAEHGGEYGAASRSSAELAKPDALPVAEGESVLADGNEQLVGSKGHFDVCGHVVGAFDGVGEEGHAFGYDVSEVVVEVAHHGGVVVFVDEDGGRSVSQEELYESYGRQVGELVGDELGDGMAALGVVV